MASHEHEAISKISSLNKLTGVDEIIKNQKMLVPSDNTLPDKAYFDALMNKRVEKGDGVALIDPMNKEAVAKAIPPVAQNDSFINEVSRVSSKIETSGLNSQDAGSKIENIHQKTKTSVETLRLLKQRLMDPSIRVKNAFQSPLNNKLSSIKDHIRVVSKTAKMRHLKAVDPTSIVSNEPLMSKLPKPVQKFVTLLTDGQNKLEQLDKHLATLGSKELQPATMLAIQIKMGHIQHEIELFSSLLNKSIESTKTVMNVQV